MNHSNVCVCVCLNSSVTLILKHHIKYQVLLTLHIHWKFHWYFSKISLKVKCYESYDFFIWSFMNKIRFLVNLFYPPSSKLRSSVVIFCLFSPHVSSPVRHFRLLPRPLFSPALPVVHSSGWEWTSQLASLKETHISGCSPFASVIFPSVETWPLSVHWLNISLPPLPSLSVFLPASAVTATTRLCRSVKV